MTLSKSLYYGDLFFLENVLLMDGMGWDGWMGWTGYEKCLLIVLILGYLKSTLKCT